MTLPESGKRNYTGGIADIDDQEKRAFYMLP